MRLFLVTCCAALLVIACEVPTGPAASGETISVPAGFDFVDGVPLVVGPADDPSAPCGLARVYKIGGRVDAGTDQGNGTWAISGCFYSHGNEMWNPQVVLTFPRGDREGEAREMVAIAARPYVAKDHREVKFGTTVRRASVYGMNAYLVTYLR